MSVQQELQVIPLHSCGGVFQNHVLLDRSGQKAAERSLVEIRYIPDRHLFPAPGNESVIFPHHRAEALHESLPGPVDRVGIFRHPLIEDLQKGKVRTVGLEYLVALQEQAVILLDIRKIGVIHLGKHGIGETPPLLAGLAHERDVGRRDHHHRKHAYMIRDFRIRFVVPAEFLRSPVLHGYGKAAVSAVLHRICAAEGE